MSIPLDHLYHYLENLSNSNIIIYRWDPHGSKNLSDLQPIKRPWGDQLISEPVMVAHDQEPLDYNFLETQGFEKIRHPSWLKYPSYVDFVNSMSIIRCKVCTWNVYEKFLLCHSEKNSPELAKFESDFIGVYYWSHGLIARDWFRFAKNDLALGANPGDYKYDFLIYNRAWSGTREYRLKFTELLVDNNLLTKSFTKFSPFDSDIHYTAHQFKNPAFKISNFSLDSTIPENTFTATSSGGYVADDYNSCGIEVVLETLFDDQRIHLTEKILRPIACGKPFILASTVGALDYLRDYGFKTFDGLIDESYNKVSDPVERLERIIVEMKRIANLSAEEKLALYSKLNEIADYNKKLFFSDAWQQQIVDEFVTNFNSAFEEVKLLKNSKKWSHAKSIVEQDPELKAHVLKTCTEEGIKLLDQHLSQ